MLACAPATALTSQNHEGGKVMSTIVTQDGAEIFYKDWSRTCSPSSKAS